MPKFVVGIGSQRAGSTLLHRILDECTNIFMHPVKELHYYDTLYGVRNENILREYSKKQVDREVDRLLKENNFSYVDKRYKCYLRANKILANVDLKKIDYIDLYRPCLMDYEFLGEITPEYMILPEVAVQKMSNDLGNETKIILITRNPVDRFVSAFKLLKLYGGKSYDMNKFADDIKEVFDIMPTWIEQQRELNDYEKSFKKYAKYFSSVKVFSYESMVGDPSAFLKSLEEFLEVDVDIPKGLESFSEKVNSIGETRSLDPVVKEIIEKKLSGVSYD